MALDHQESYQILNQFETTDLEKAIVRKHFENTTVTHAAVVEFIEKMRAI